MAKWYGKIGFVTTEETEPGVWTETIEERYYYGDLIRNTRRLQDSNVINDNINISNEISVVSDDYANDNFYAIRYVIFSNVKWKVTNVDFQYPRLILSVGGIYNG